MDVDVITLLFVGNDNTHYSYIDGGIILCTQLLIIENHQNTTARSTAVPFYVYDCCFHAIAITKTLERYERGDYSDVFNITLRIHEISKPSTAF